MPTYKYKCQNEKCNHEFEIKQSIKDDKLKTCDKCKEDKLDRVPQKSDFVLNGDGWFNKGGY